MLARSFILLVILCCGVAVSPVSGGGAAPNIDPPLHCGWELRLRAGVCVLEADEAGETDWGRFYLLDGNEVMAYDAQTGERAWESPAVFRLRPALLYAVEKRVVLRTRFEVIALDAASGKRLWSYGAYPAGLDDVDADHENFDALRYHALSGNMAVVVRESGAAVGLDIATGEPRWEREMEPRPVGAVLLSKSFVVYPAMRRGESIVCVLDRSNGKLLSAFELEEHVRPGRLLIAADETIVAAAPPLLYGFDGRTGEQRWKRRQPERFELHTLVSTGDGLVVPASEGRIEKLRCVDGETAWRSEPLRGRVGGKPRLEATADVVYVIGDGTVAGVDANTGRVLFDSADAGESDESWQVVAGKWLVTVRATPNPEGETLSVRFREGRTGRVAEVELPAGAHPWGRIESVQVREGALIVRTESRLVGLVGSGERE